MTTTLARALAVLDSLSDDVPLGAWRAPDGTLGRLVTREEWRAGLLDGSVDPAALLRTVALLRAVESISSTVVEEIADRPRLRLIRGGGA